MNPSFYSKKNKEPSQNNETPEFIDKVVYINRCAKVVKGGRRFSFSALVVSGDQKGRIGVGQGKAKEVSESIRKGTEQAQKHLEHIQLNNSTIPHSVTGVADGARVLLIPARLGTGVIAGGSVRPVLEAVGVKDILSKSQGSNNKLAVVNATLDGLRKLRSVESIRKIRSTK